jgi:hypothetical protein
MKSTKVAAELADWLRDADVVIGTHYHQLTVPPERVTRVQNACCDSTVRFFIRCSDFVNLSFELESPDVEFNLQSTKLAWCDLAIEISRCIAQVSSRKSKERLKVVVDLTDADWEVGFFTLPVLYKDSKLDVVCTFTSPDKYPQAEAREAHPPVDTYSIRQPPGWTANLSGTTRSTRHVLFLGFDHDRAQKFIEHYDWVREHCIAVLGNPAYVSNGVNESEKANALLLKQIPNTPENRRIVGAANPVETMKLLEELFAKHGALNIMLLGTSPMTLGAVWFYLQLSDQEKANVRFLHDFPLRQTGRTSGVGQTWLYSRPTDKL